VHRQLALGLSTIFNTSLAIFLHVHSNNLGFSIFCIIHHHAGYTLSLVAKTFTPTLSFVALFVVAHFVGFAEGRQAHTF
jgi:E3 ubiquitin-protein ligase DOA10